MSSLERTVDDVELEKKLGREEEISLGNDQHLKNYQQIYGKRDAQQQKVD